MTLFRNRGAAERLRSSWSLKGWKVESLEISSQNKYGVKRTDRHPSLPSCLRINQTSTRIVEYCLNSRDIVALSLCALFAVGRFEWLDFMYLIFYIIFILYIFLNQNIFKLKFLNTNIICFILLYEKYTFMCWYISVYKIKVVSFLSN